MASGTVLAIPNIDKELVFTFKHTRPDSAANLAKVDHYKITGYESKLKISEYDLEWTLISRNSKPT